MSLKTRQKPWLWGLALLFALNTLLAGCTALSSKSAGAQAVPYPPNHTSTPCHLRIVDSANLLAVVTRTYGLSPESKPAELVALSDYLPVTVTKGYDTEVHAQIIEPLMALIEAMQAEGLRPYIISGYRSHSTQVLAWRKWHEKAPEHAEALSAPPGHSEHQLGTTVDFGSPELPGLTNIRNIEFHTYFARTSEGKWLSDNAHKYGFTLSYRPHERALTGFYYEPWHYRYVGESMATFLYKERISLTAYQLHNYPEPCIPHE